jgi:SAM-dependent methyltransferase
LIERPRCPVCDAAPGPALYRSAFDAPPIRNYLFRFYPELTDDDLQLLSSAEFVLERCPACDLVWQRFAPSDLLLRRIYESWVADTGGLSRHDDLAYHRSAAEEILLVLELANRSPSEVAVLDFGMGLGRWPRLAVALGCRASGVELAGPQADFARSQGVTVLALDQPPDNEFFFINSEQVFEHLVDPRTTLIRLARSLSPDGWIKIAVPDARHVADRLQHADWTASKGSVRSLNAVAPLEHLNCFSRTLSMCSVSRGDYAAPVLPCRPCTHRRSACGRCGGLLVDSHAHLSAALRRAQRSSVTPNAD